MILLREIKSDLHLDIIIGFWTWFLEELNDFYYLVKDKISGVMQYMTKIKELLSQQLIYISLVHEIWHLKDWSVYLI